MMGGGALGNVGSHDTRGRGQLTRRNEACCLCHLLPGVLYQVHAACSWVDGIIIAAPTPSWWSTIPPSLVQALHDEGRADCRQRPRIHGISRHSRDDIRHSQPLPGTKTLSLVLRRERGRVCLSSRVQRRAWGAQKD